MKSIELARDSFNGQFDAFSWRNICAAVRLLSKGRRIVTDRLHGHILAIMMGKEHDFYDNSYGKNCGFYRTWTHVSPLVTFVGRMESATPSEVKSDRPAPNAQPQVQEPAAFALQAKFNLGGRCISRGSLRTQSTSIGKFCDNSQIILRRCISSEPLPWKLGTRSGSRTDREGHWTQPQMRGAHDRGLALSELKRPEDALESYNKAIALNPDFAEAHKTAAMRCRTWSATRRTGELRQGDRAGTMLCDGAQQPRVCTERPAASCGSARELRQGDLELEPGLAMAHMNRGKALIALKRHEEALASCNKAISLKAEIADAHHIAFGLNEAEVIVRSDFHYRSQYGRI